MEKNGSIDQQQQQQPSSSLSWLLDNKSRPSKSLWLQTTLAELDGKIKKILEVVEDDGDTFAQRAEMYYQKKPELIKLVGDLHKSYQALADKYHLMIMLRSDQSLEASNNNKHSFTTSLSNSLLGQLHGSDSDASENHQDHEYLLTKKQQKEKPLMRSKSEDDSRISEGEDECGHHNDDQKKMVNIGAGGLDELLEEVSKLIEENTSNQAQLIKRYDMKREDMKQLEEENRRLRDALLMAQTDFGNKQSSSRSRTRTNTNNSKSKWKASCNLFRKFLP